jgi:hypothetical protein
MNARDELLGYCKSCNRSIHSSQHHSYDGDNFYCERCKPMNSLIQKATSSPTKAERLEHNQTSNQENNENDNNK